MRYIYRPDGSETVMHIQEHDRTGVPLLASLCGEMFGRDGRQYLTCNMPLGVTVCRSCDAELETIHNEAKAATS